LLIRVLKEILKQDGDVNSKIKKLIQFKKFYRNLNEGIKNRSIFHYCKNQNIELEELISRLNREDIDLINKLFKYDVKEFLKKNNLSKSLNFQKRKFSNQIGINTIFVETPLIGLWTTGKSTFYVPTKINHDHKIMIEMQSIPPLNCEVEFDGKMVHNENFSKLTTKKINLFISSLDVVDSVSEISINTDKLWLPNVILGINQSVKIGIKINSILVIF